MLMGDIFGIQHSGWTGPTGSPEAWTIGTPGQFTSVYQALGGTTSTVDFFLSDLNGQWGANALPVATPEPGSFALLGMGMLAFGTITLFRKQTA